MGIFVFSPVVMKITKKVPLVTATSNAKQVFYILVDFDHRDWAIRVDEEEWIEQKQNRRLSPCLTISSY